MKKTLIIVLALVLSLGVATLAFAEDTTGTSTINNAMAKIKNLPQLILSDEQKAQKTSLMTQMLELDKQIIQSNVDNGTITADQAKIMQEHLEQRMEAIKSGDLGPGKGGRGMRGGHRPFPQQQQTQTTN